MKSLFLVLITVMLISCGGGGGRHGTCYGSAQVCGDGSANSNSSNNGSNSQFQGVIATGSVLVEYVISGTTTEASLLLFENGQDLTEQRLNVKLPLTLSFNRETGDTLAILAQNNFAVGIIKVVIKINGIEQRTDQSAAAYGTAFVTMTCCR